MNQCDFLSSLLNDAQFQIYSLCGLRELGRLSSVSKKISLLVNSDSIWQALCLRENSRLMRKGIPWKEVYRDEIDYLKYRGNFIIVGSYKINSENNLPQSNSKTALFLARIRTDLESMTILHLKKIVRKNLNLEFKLAEIGLYLEDKKLEESYSIEDLKSIIKQQKDPHFT